MHSLDSVENESRRLRKIVLSHANPFYVGYRKSAAEKEGNEDIWMQGYPWSPFEKKAARTAFDLALARDMKETKRGRSHCEEQAGRFRHWEPA